MCSVFAYVCLTCNLTAIPWVSALSHTSPMLTTHARSNAVMVDRGGGERQTHGVASYWVVQRQVTVGYSGW